MREHDASDSHQWILGEIDGMEYRQCAVKACATIQFKHEGEWIR
jgi:hypothetical protein